MFRVWIEDLIEINLQYTIHQNRQTRDLLVYYNGSSYFHSNEYFRFAYYLD